MRIFVPVFGAASFTTALLAAAFFAGAIPASSFGQEKRKTRDQLVIEDRDGLSDSTHWIYNDLAKASAGAQRTRQPLMVVHRCIP